MPKKIIFLIFLITPVLCAQQIFAEEKDLQISGYYKNLFISTKSSASKEDIFSSNQRLRLELKKQVDPWQFYLTLDNEAIINDFANTPDFSIIRSKTQDNLASWDLDKVSVDNDHLYLKHSIYRAYMKYYSPEFQATLGKQAIDWGKMRFYSPLDVFNPTGPIDLEPEERVGVDAVNLNFSKSFSGINLVAVPGEDSKHSSFGLKLYKTISPYDLSFIAASIKEDIIMGFSFDGYIKNAGFRGEITHQELDNGKSFPRVSLGVDYNFTEKLYFLMEQFFNGGHEDNDPDDFASSYQLARKIFSLKKNLTSMFWKYSLTPLIDVKNTTIYDWDGKSVVDNPELKYNFSSNSDVAVGSQLFWGKTNSEFGSNEHLYYVEFKWFF